MNETKLNIKQIIKTSGASNKWWSKVRPSIFFLWPLKLHLFHCKIIETFGFPQYGPLFWEIEKLKNFNSWKLIWFSEHWPFHSSKKVNVFVSLTNFLLLNINMTCRKNKMHTLMTLYSKNFIPFHTKYKKY